MNLSNVIRTGKSVITANSPVLLLGAAVTGVVATGVLAAKAGYKARGIIDEAEVDRLAAAQPPLDTKDKVKLTWLCYAAPALTGATTVASAVGVHVIHTKRYAAFAGLYAITATKLDDYKDEAEKLLGPKKSQALTDSIAQKSFDRNSDFENSEVILTPNGSELVYDDWSARTFTGSMNKIGAAVLAVNNKLIHDDSVSLNEFYDELGLSPCGMGDNYGWSGEQVEIQYGAIQVTDGRPAISISFRTEPKANLGLR